MFSNTFWQNHSSGGWVLLLIIRENRGGKVSVSGDTQSKSVYTFSVTVGGGVDSRHPVSKQDPSGL